MGDIGHNGGPPLPFNKKRWVMALFAEPNKPSGAVAMAFKLYVEMDAQGRGAAVSDAEFMVCCGVSDGSCRNFKRWLVDKRFIQISRRGYRGHRSEFLATIPGETIAAPDAAINEGIPATIAGKNTPEYRQPLPANTDSLPATAAAIPQSEQKSPHTPLKDNINNNNQLASLEYASPRELAGLNGSADPMISDILGWMGSGTEANARQWLSTFVQTFGQEVVRNSYMKLKTDLLSGNLLAKPLQTWTKIAQRMKAEPTVAKEAAQTESRATRMRRFAQEARQEREDAAKKGYRR